VEFFNSGDKHAITKSVLGKTGKMTHFGVSFMQSHEEAKKLARQKLLEAERDLDNYVHSSECDYETLKRLSDAVHAARREHLDLLAALWPEGGRAVQTTF
jgi:hypothetical protein